MIVYASTKSDFVDDVRANRIEDKILTLFHRCLGRSTSRSEVDAWRNSMQYMHNILVHSRVPDTAGVAIEFNIPQTSKRIDFILTGEDDRGHATVVIVELKQWQEARRTGMDGVVTTALQGREVETNHPSLQAWSYAAMLEDFCETIRDEGIRLHPCAYLHNCISPNEINHPFYAEHTERAPAFLKADSDKLTSFIERFVKRGDRGDLIYRIDRGRIRPSKSLADALVGMLRGNREFLLIDDQKLVYETALALAGKAEKGCKQVLIVEGGPGTGKSVVAVNLLVEFINREKTAHYVTKNAAPRLVYRCKLSGTLTRSRIENLFRGSGCYVDAKPDEIDVLIVDEAHRLNEKSGMYQNRGENQIKEIIRSSKLSVFFIDEDQRVTWKDAGSSAEIKQRATLADAVVTEMALQSQFRCNGSNAYLAWLDHVLQIRETANHTLASGDFDFRVFDNPAQLRQIITEKNRVCNKARMVAGYCWDWSSKNDKRKTDIRLPEYGFEMRWNLREDGGLWILRPESVNEIGCIHTCQGLEMDYVGVIVGPDLVVRNGAIHTIPEKRSRMDASLKGLKKLAALDSSAAAARASTIIKNTYRTLMTRGQKGCYIFCTDPETNEYFRRALDSAAEPAARTAGSPHEGIHLRVLDPSDVQPYRNAVPLFDLRIAAGDFSDPQTVESCDWVELPEPFTARPGYFVTRIVGESMNRRIPSGSWCLFRANPTGSREGKVVLVQHRDIQDPDHGQFTVKIYHSEKSYAEDRWQHAQIILRPDSLSSGFSDIVLERDEAVDLKVVGEFVASLGQRMDAST